MERKSLKEKDKAINKKTSEKGKIGIRKMMVRH